VSDGTGLFLDILCDVTAFTASYGYNADGTGVLSQDGIGHKIPDYRTEPSLEEFSLKERHHGTRIELSFVKPTPQTMSIPSISSRTPKPASHALTTFATAHPSAYLLPDPISGISALIPKSPPVAFLTASLTPATATPKAIQLANSP
jgi:hypothetical protein